MVGHTHASFDADQIAAKFTVRRPVRASRRAGIALVLQKARMPRNLGTEIRHRSGERACARAGRALPIGRGNVRG
ncbi:MAG TPA: hypothetical protein VGH49_05630, partial [Xanthobacteraceae bacterium]